jgi:hypothetical protein
MMPFKWRMLVLFGLCVVGLTGCGGNEPQSDANLPTRRAKMRDMKINTDMIMAALKNESLEGVEANAKRIRENLHAVSDLYPTEHKEKFITYNNESQNLAIAIATSASAGNVKEANKNFRALVPYCTKCHEDCAYMLAPAFPEYEP